MGHPAPANAEGGHPQETKSRSLTAIRKKTRLGSHPKTRRTGVFWGPRVRDDSKGTEGFFDFVARRKLLMSMTFAARASTGSRAGRPVVHCIPRATTAHWAPTTWKCGRARGETKSRSLTAIRKKMRLGSHPKTRRTGVFWGPRVRDDSVRWAGTRLRGRDVSTLSRDLRSWVGLKLTFAQPGVTVPQQTSPLPDLLTP
jgi:hypothetical protein